MVNLKIKMEGKTRRMQLFVAEKIRILTVAKEIGNRAASRQFDVSEACNESDVQNNVCSKARSQYGMVVRKWKNINHKHTFLVIVSAK